MNRARSNQIRSHIVTVSSKVSKVRKQGQTTNPQGYRGRLNRPCSATKPQGPKLDPHRASYWKMRNDRSRLVRLGSEIGGSALYTSFSCCRSNDKTVIYSGNRVSKWRSPHCSSATWDDFGDVQHMRARPSACFWGKEYPKQVIRTQSAHDQQGNTDVERKHIVAVGMYMTWDSLRTIRGPGKYLENRKLCEIEPWVYMTDEIPCLSRQIEGKLIWDGQASPELHPRNHAEQRRLEQKLKKEQKWQKWWSSRDYFKFFAWRRSLLILCNELLNTASNVAWNSQTV